MPNENEALITKYRPDEWDQVLGNDALVASLKDNIEKGSAHTYCFIGPSGCGKTTLARIAAHHSGCADSDITEVDAATYAGVNEMRELTKSLQYRPLNKSGKRSMILDEVHRLSGQAWDTLLKVLEEPPSWLFWFLCTTEPQKIPKTILTRATVFTVHPCNDDDLSALLETVAEAEGLKVKSAILNLCVSESGGSPRQALSNLSTCRNAKNAEDAAELLRSATDSPEAVELAKALIAGQSWAKLAELLKKLKEMNPESIRHVVRAYTTAIALNAKGDANATRCLEILQAFAQPFNSQDGISPVVLAVGRICFA